MVNVRFGDARLPERFKSCVYPVHIEPVTRSVNTMRGKSDHCPRGHPYNKENTYLYDAGSGSTHRNCRTCHRDRERERYSKLEVVVHG